MMHLLPEATLTWCSDDRCCARQVAGGCAHVLHIICATALACPGTDLVFLEAKEPRSHSFTGSISHNGYDT